MTDLTTDTLKRLAESITPGPWNSSIHGSQVLTGDSWNTICEIRVRKDFSAAQWEDGRGSSDPTANARAIALVPALIREVLAHRKAEAWQPIETISRAAQDVLAERQRQISVEGWDDTHDDCNDKSELAQAAACYALSGTPADEAVFIHGRWKDPRDLFWPWTWDRSWWKPTNRRRDLVKAGALILAEIERLDRAAPEAEGGRDERA